MKDNRRFKSTKLEILRLSQNGNRLFYIKFMEKKPEIFNDLKIEYDTRESLAFEHHTKFATLTDVETNESLDVITSREKIKILGEEI